MNIQKGFTLIELMVVIVIIGILSALAIPKMFGVSAKAKAAEAPSAIANWETLQSAYSQETGAGGLFAAIGFKDPTADSKWFTYVGTVTLITATVKRTFGDCTQATDGYQSTFAAATDSFTHAGINATTSAKAGACGLYQPNFYP